jgi:hypothetical protein
MEENVWPVLIQHNGRETVTGRMGVLLHAVPSIDPAFEAPTFKVVLRPNIHG